MRVMQTLHIVVPMLIASSCLLFSCHRQPTEYSSDGRNGSARVQIVVEKVGVLSKTAENEQIILKSLIVTLTADGETTRCDTLSLPPDGSTTVSSIYENLGAGKKWTLSARSIDTRDSTVHSGSTPFIVMANQVVSITLDLTARYSILIARFFPIPDSVNRVQLKLDNMVVADSTFPKQGMVGDTVTLTYDYLTTTVAHSITMNVYGDLNGSGMLLYQGSYYLTAVPGENSVKSVPLNWVGPAIVPAGNGNISVAIGAAARTIVEGECKGTTAKEPTKVSGTISTNTTWTTANSPYLLTGDVTVSNAATLTVGPGVVINGQNYWLRASGTLRVAGTSNSHVSINNTRIAPGTVSGTGNRYFVSICFADLNTCDLFKSTAAYGKGSLVLRDSRLSNVSYISLGAPIEDCYIERNIFMHCDYITTELIDTSDCYIRNNVFFEPGNTRSIQNTLSRGTGTTIVEYNSFLSIGTCAVKLPPGNDSARIISRNNYWHTTDPETIAGMIYDVNDDTSCAGVIEYLPVLTAPDPATPRFGF